MQYDFLDRNLAEALHAALTEDAFYIAMETSVSDATHDRREAMFRYFDYSMREAHLDGHLDVHEDSAAAIWNLPLSGDRARDVKRSKTDFLRAHMGEPSVDTYERVGAFMSNQSSPIISEDAWYLSILGVAPGKQGEGLGGRLIRTTLRRADRAGVPTYLETFTPRNESFYESILNFFNII